MYDVGENGNGPMNFDSIARILRAEGYLWTADLHNKWSRKRNEHTKSLVYDWQIKKALTDCTYQGRQVYAGQEWPCEAYLVDGQPVVPTDLWERVQARIHSEKRVGNAGQVRRAMTGLLRCGLCGQGLNVHSGTASLADGTKKTYAYWINPKSESWCWCTHKLPILREEVLDAYIDEALTPLLLAEIREREAEGDHAALTARQAQVQRELTECERQLTDVLPAYGLKVTPDMLAAMERKILQNMADLQRQFKDLSEQTRSLDGRKDRLTSIQDASPAMRRDVVRSALRWAVILPSDLPREATPRYTIRSRTRPAAEAGRLVFLSVWGTYHTATIRREHNGVTDHRQFVLAPAPPDQVVGGVAEFPDPDAFVAGLRRAYAGRKYPHSPDECAPGYDVTRTAHAIATFETGFKDAPTKGEEETGLLTCAA